MKIEYDHPNLTYELVGNYIYQLANIGATDKELKKLFSKGGDATLKDIAKIRCKHTHYLKELTGTIPMPDPNESMFE